MVDSAIYGKLDIGQQSIQVATILPSPLLSRGKLRLTLNILSLWDNPDFEVLSYSSRDAGAAITIIDVNGTRLPITANLDEALRQMRAGSNNRPLHVWIHPSEALHDAEQFAVVQEVQEHARNVRNWAKQPIDYSKIEPNNITGAMLFESMEGAPSTWDDMRGAEARQSAVRALATSTGTQASARPPASLSAQAPALPKTSSHRFRNLLSPQPRLYGKLDRKKNQIRVATIHPDSDSASLIRLSLETVSLDDNIDFEALSYCWGDPDIKEKILVNDISWSVTVNLHAALCAFRIHAGSRNVRIWIDAVCINQQDTPERDWQVTLMGEVYTRARNVRTWLGPGDLSDPGRTALAFDRLRWITSKPKASITDDDILANLELLRDLFRNPYWHRRWITQEIVLAREISIYRGSSFEPKVELRALYDTLNRLANHLQMAIPYHNDRQVWDVVDHDKDVWKHHQTYQEILNAISPITAFDKPLTEHPYLLRDIRGAQQTNDRDCVYGILGLLKRDLGHTLVVPNYELPIVDIFQDFAYKLMTASKSLAFLYEAYPEDKSLPTWVPDLRVTSRANNRYIPDEVPIELEDAQIGTATYRTGIRFPNSETQRRTNMLAQLDHLFDASAGTKFFARLPATGVIHLRGVFVDHIADCLSHDKGLRDIHPTTVMEGWIPMDWMDLYRTAISWSQTPSQDTFEDEMLIRTLSADCILPQDAPARRLSQQDARARCQAIQLQRDTPGLIIQHPTSFLDSNMSLYHFFVTSDGRPGITFGDAQVGDMIAIVSSLKMPLIVRGSRYADPEDVAAAADRQLLDPAYKGRSLETFTLVGSCYVHGMMDGEAVRGLAQERWCGVEEVFEDLFLI